MTKKNHNETLVLITERPDTYYSNDDETFSKWIKKIDSIERIGYIGKKLCIEIDREKLDTDDLIELMALFKRYNLPNMEQFQQFLTARNKTWFRKKEEDSFWYDDVWGKPFKKPTKKTHKPLTLCITSPTFHHRHDEETFYEWLNKARCIETITKQDAKLVLVIPNPSLVYDEDLGSLIALFHRYKIPGMEQFQQFVSEDRSWVADWKEAYWYKKVWPKKKNNK